MPQLELSSYVSQIFWLLLSFCVLWFMISVFIMPKLTDIIEQRKRKIDEYLQSAEALNNKAQSSLEKYNETISSAEKKAEEQRNEAKKELAASLHQTETNMINSLNKKIAENEFMLAKEKKDTLLQIEVIAQDLAYQIVQKLGFKSINRQNIADVSQKGKIDG